MRLWFEIQRLLVSIPPQLLLVFFDGHTPIQLIKGPLRVAPRCGPIRRTNQYLSLNTVIRRGGINGHRTTASPYTTLSMSSCAECRGLPRMLRSEASAVHLCVSP